MNLEVESIGAREDGSPALQSQESQEDTKIWSVDKDAAKAAPTSVGPADSAADLYFNQQSNGESPNTNGRSSPASPLTLSG